MIPETVPRHSLQDFLLASIRIIDGCLYPSKLANASAQPMLLDEVRAVARMRHLSIRTEQAYSQWIRRFIRFHHKRHPRDMGEVETRAFISHLAVEGAVTASTQTVALSALLFLYRDVLKQELPYVSNIERARKPKRLPVVFTRDEIKRILINLDGVHCLWRVCYMDQVSD